jgi:uncharacterized delta-60 repeat protein
MERSSRGRNLLLNVKCTGRWSVGRWTVQALLPLIVAVGTAGSAGAATFLSEATWGGPVSEVTEESAVAPDGSTYLAGFTTSFDQFGQENLFVVKFGADASLVWQRRWDGPEVFGNDRATDVAVAADGSVYVTGSTFGVAGDALLLKFSAEGTLVWQLRWGASGTERGEGVAVGADGAIYVAGGTTSFGGTFVLKFAPDGALVWQKVWGQASGEGVAVAPDGSIYVAGTGPRPDGAFGNAIVVLKLDASGSLVWQRVYSAGEIADARGGIAVGPDGSAYVAGAIQDATRKVVVDALLLKFDSAGNLVWDRGWGGRSGDVSGSVGVAPDGTVLWAGETNSYGAGSDDGYLLLLSPDGRSLDGNTWGGLEIDHFEGVDAAANGTISLGATTQGPPFSFLRAPTKTSRLRGTVATPTAPLEDAAGTLADPGGTVDTPAGTTPGGGGIDAALVRVAP